MTLPRIDLRRKLAPLALWFVSAGVVGACVLVSMHLAEGRNTARLHRGAA